MQCGNPLFVILSLLSISYVILYTSHVNIGIWKELTYPSLSLQQLEIRSNPTLNRLVECDTSLQLISFPPSLGIHQQTHTRRKPYEYWNT